VIGTAVLIGTLALAGDPLEDVLERAGYVRRRAAPHELLAPGASLYEWVPQGRGHAPPRWMLFDGRATRRIFSVADLRPFVLPIETLAGARRYADLLRLFSIPLPLDGAEAEITPLLAGNESGRGRFGPADAARWGVRAGPWTEVGCEGFAIVRPMFVDRVRGERVPDDEHPLFTLTNGARYEPGIVALVAERIGRDGRYAASTLRVLETGRAAARFAPRRFYM